MLLHKDSRGNASISLGEIAISIKGRRSWSWDEITTTLNRAGLRIVKQIKPNKWKLRAQ